MSKTATLSLLGTLERATNTQSFSDQILQSISGEIDVKAKEVTVPHGSVWTSVGLDLPPTIDETLVVAIYASNRVLVELTGKNAANTAPVVLGALGRWFVTFTPGNGITALRLRNDDATLDVEVDVVLVNLKPYATVPEFWSST